MIHWQQSVEEIYAHWQTQLESSQETGHLPLLMMGFSDRLIEGIPALFALSRLATNRTDLTTPTCVIGGNGALWVAVLSQQARVQAEAKRDVNSSNTESPAIHIIYGGADAATTMANTSIVAQSQLHDGEVGATGLPAGMWHLFVPATQPGVPETWSALPFMVMLSEDRWQDEPVTPATAASHAKHDTNQWFAYAAILLTLLLLVSALFV